MPKIVYDVIQRFEVENGIPHLVSTTIQVIQGGEDLLSLAINLLTQLSFQSKFVENRTSQYIGYRANSPKKSSKRYQLVLSQRKENLSISIPKEILQDYILELEYYSFTSEPELKGYRDNYDWITLGIFWVLPSRKTIFLKSIKYKTELKLNEATQGKFCFQWTTDNVVDREYPIHFDVNNLSDKDSYLVLQEDTLFPYMWQVSISSRDVLEEFIDFFGKVLMKENQV